MIGDYQRLVVGTDDVVRTIVHGVPQLDILHIKNPASVREFFNRWIRFGYISAHSEQLTGRGRPAAQYVITGAARLVAGIAYTWDPV
jgi:hypothetical protein